jgi:hypothetical protein
MNRRACLLAACTVLALMLPSGSSSAASEPEFAGFSGSSRAAPVKLEIYEPTIPLPASPQAELELAWTNAKGFTGQMESRASWLWPGDSMGTGFRTYGEALGLPEQLWKDGYPVQVNAAQPQGKPSQSNEQLPGTSMRASAEPASASATAGFTSDGDVSEPEPGSTDPPVDPLTELMGTSGITAGGTDGARAGEEAAPGALPPELAALVDVGAATSTSTLAAGDQVTAAARASASDVSIAAGLITIRSVATQARSISTAKDATVAGKSLVTGITIAGQPVTLDGDGLHVAGQGGDLPGLPDDPAKALEELGITLSLPAVAKKRAGRLGEVDAAGLRIVIDVAQLRSKLAALPIDDLIAAIPDDAGDLKKLLGAVANLAPKIVLTLGVAEVSTETVPAIPPPPVDPGDDSPADDTDDPPPASDDAPPAAAAPAAGAPAPGAVPPAETAPAGPAPTTDPVTTMAGLPDLTSIPGLLMYGGIGAAFAAGTWLRRVGLIVLGGGATCGHGLATGLPDLRKA